MLNRVGSSEALSNEEPSIVSEDQECKFEGEDQLPEAITIKDLRKCQFKDKKLNQSIENQMVVFLIKSVTLFAANALFWGYLYTYEIANGAVLAFVISSLFICPVSHFLVLYFESKNDNGFKIGIVPALQLMSSISIVSVFGASEFFLELKKIKWYKVMPPRIAQLLLQIILVCVNTSNWGGLPISFITVALFHLISVLLLIKMTGGYSEYTFEEFKLLLSGTSKALLNWLDIITDLAYVVTTEFYHPVLLALSVTFIFTSPLFQAALHYRKSQQSISAFIQTFVCSFFGIYEALIGYELFQERDTNLEGYYNAASVVHTLAESLPQIILALTNSLLIGNPTFFFYLSISVSLITLLVFLVLGLIGAKKVVKEAVPTLKKYIAGELMLASTLGMLWNINLVYLDYCDEEHLNAAIIISWIVFYLINILSCICHCPNRVYGIFSACFYHLVTNSSTLKQSIFWLIFFFLFKFAPMFAFLISNASCNGTINSFSIAVLVGLFFDLLYEVSKIIPEPIIKMEMGRIIENGSSNFDNVVEKNTKLEFVIQIMKMNGMEKLNEDRNKVRLSSDNYKIFAKALLSMKKDQVNIFKFYKKSKLYRSFCYAFSEIGNNLILHVKLIDIQSII